MNEVSFFADKIAEVHRELGISTASGFLEMAHAHIDKISKSEASNIDVYTTENPSQAIKKKVQSWVANNSGVIEINDLKPSALGARSITAIAPSIAICFFDEETDENLSTANHIVSLREQYKIVLIINCLSDDAAVEQWARQLYPAIKYKIVEFVQLEGKSVELFLLDVISIQQLSLLKMLGRLNQVKPVLTLLHQIFVTENKVTQTRKLLNSQNQLITRKDEQALNNMDVANLVRQAIQKFTNDIEKSLRAKYEELNKPVTGTLSKEVVSLAEQLTDFKRETVAEKDERVEVKLTDDFQSMFLGKVKSIFSTEMQHDKDYLTVSVNELVNRINSQLAIKQIGQISLSNNEQQLPDVTKSITPFCQFNKQYKSELIKKGLMEYFVALRDYTGIIMVATGLLGPLTIIAGISENGFLKHLSNAIKFGMAGIALFLIVYGIYDLRTRIPRKREEEFEKELEKAREYVQNEGKRIGNDISRDWISANSNWVKEISATLSSAFERKLKEVQQGKANMVNQEKIQQQRRQQSIESQLRNIASAERIKDATVNRFREMYLETDRKLVI